MRDMVKVAMIIGLVGTAAPAAAQAFNGSQKLARGDYAAAEREIVAQRALYPDDIDLMLNLATVYMKTGRPAVARRVYHGVAESPDETVVLSNGESASSRALAAAMLARLPSEVAAR